MAYLATNVFIGDGVKTFFDFSFAGVSPDADSGTTPYLYAVDVKATELYIDIEGNAQEAERIVTIDPALPLRANIVGLPVVAGRQIKIYRSTEIRFPLVDYRDQQSVSEFDLDLANRQAIFVAQEARDLSMTTVLTGAIRVAGTESVAPIPENASNRAGKILTFDMDGQPQATFLNSGTAVELEMALASTAAGKGASKVYLEGGGTVQGAIIGLLDADTVLAADIAALESFDANLHDGQVAVTQPLTGAATITQHDKNAQTVHIRDFISIPASTWLSRAMDGTPAGGVLELGPYTYTAKFAKIRSDITLRGSGRPRRNGAKTGLTGGTIIQGTVGITGQSIHVENIGFDNGQPVLDAMNGGVGMDGLVLNDATRADLHDCSVKSCISFAPHGATAHGFLLEGCVDSQFSDLHSYGGLWGVVGKTQRCTFDGIFAYGCTEAGFTFKSDSGVAGALCLKSSANNIYVSADGYTDCKTGILVYAATSSLADCQISNYIVDGCQTPLKVLCDTRATNVNLILGLQLTNGTLNAGTVTGYESFGACNDVEITNLRIIGTTSGKSIQVGADNLGTSFVNVSASMPTGIATPLNVNIAGRFSISSMRSFVNGDYNSPAGINLVPDSASTFKLGVDILGTVGFNGVQTWTPTFTGLTVVNGTGGVTITGSYVIIGKVLKFRVTISTTGTATTASSASGTFINNLPFPVLQNGPLQAISGTVTQGGVGLVAQGGTNGYTPTWSAYNGTFTITGEYLFQA